MRLWLVKVSTSMFYETKLETTLKVARTEFQLT